MLAHVRAHKECGRAGFHRQFGNRLTDVAVVVHDLGNGETLARQVMAVQQRGIVGGGEDRPATLARQRRMISSRWRSMNSYSMTHHHGACVTRSDVPKWDSRIERC
jgi:hypothetical protein